MAIKDQYVYYQARNSTTGLTDVTANVFLDADGADTAVATGLALAEIDAGNFPGGYALLLTAAQIAGFGGAGVYSVHINSATQNAPAIAKLIVTVNDNDDLEALLVGIETKIDTIDAEVGALQSDMTSVKATVENSNTVLNDVNIGNANLKALLDGITAAVTSVQNNTSFVAVIPPQLEIPDSGNNRVKVPIRVFDNEGNLEDPDTNQIQVSAENENGLDRTNYIVGFTSGPVDASRTSQGIYFVELDIPSTAGTEQLVLLFSYAEGGLSKDFPRTAELVPAAAASGFALQSTLLDVLTDTADMQPRVVAIENLINDPTNGLANIKALIDVIDGVVDSNNAELVNATYGLSALKTILDTKASQLSVDAIQTILNSDVKGTGFNGTTDSLAAISDRSFFGGRAF